MSFKSLIASILGLSYLAISYTAYGTESVRVVSNPDEAQTTFSISYSSDKSPKIALDISTVSVTNVNLDSKEMQQANIAVGEDFAVGALSEDGKPDLPAVTSMFIIPDNAGLSFSVSYSGYDDIENIELAPVQPSPQESDIDRVIPFTKDETIYSENSFYPGELAQVGEPFIMRDIRGAQVSIYPLQYNPASKTLRVYRDLSVQISYDGEVVNPRTQSRPYISEAFYPIYKSLFSNFDEVFSNAEIKRGGYLIIAKATIADSLKALAAWKHQKGYTTRIVRTNEINSSGNPTGPQIYSYLQNAYNTWETPPEYVVLAGDVDGSMAIIDYPYSNYRSDQRYACVDGPDYMPDIFIGRMSVDNLQQVRMTSAKAIKYEKFPSMDDPGRYLRGVSVGFTLFQTARTLTLWVRELALMHGFTRVDTIYASTYNSHLIELMNTAPGLSWYRGEAGSEGWWGPNYYISDMNAMPNNQKLSVMFPVACGMGDFSRNECMGEVWIRMGLNPDSLKGGPCFYGTTEYGCHTRWNNPHFMGFFWALFEQNNYHFAAATVAGKMQLYRMHPRYVQNGSVVQQYFNTFNIIGDPDTEIRTDIPNIITVAHPDTIPFGLNHLDLAVIDTSGRPVPDAFVTLIKGADSTEEVFSVCKTDEMGNASLSFNALTTGDMILTVTGRNLYPYQGHIEIANSDLAVGYQSLIINDDQLGYSFGNNDTLANPNETLELYLTLKNFGNAGVANNVFASISSIGENEVDIYESTRNFGDFMPGEIRNAGLPFVLHLRTDLHDGQNIRLKLTTIDNAGHSWDSEFEIPINAPDLILSNVAIHDSNNRLDRGDTAQIVISLSNEGHSIARDVNAILSSDDDFISVISAGGSFGDIAMDSTSSNLLFPMIIFADQAPIPHREVHLSLRTTTSSGSEQTIPIQISVDSTLRNTDPTGPDSYGYYMYDNRDTLYDECQDFEWVELVPDLGGLGERLDFGSHTDDYSVLVPLPFNIKYYGDDYSAVIVSCNGFISPDTFTVDMQGNYWSNFFNAPIPDPANARAQISPFWDDLAIQTSGNYGIFTWNDSTNHRFIIEWNHTTHRNTGSAETFQMIIYDPVFYPTITGDAEMLFQYNSILDTDSDENYSTVGIENWNQDGGLQYIFDHAPSPGGRNFDIHFKTIKVTTNTGMAGIRGTVDLIGGDSDSGATVKILSGPSRTTSDSGAYWITNIVPGSVTMIAEAPGYLAQYQFDVIALGNQTIPNIDFELQPCPIPTGLMASDSLSGRIDLNWNSVSHPNFMGYYVYRSHWQSGGYERITLNPITETHYIDFALPDSSIYWYYASAIYSNNQWVSESFESEKDHGMALPISIAEDNTQIPSQFFLAQNYPNPFNPTTSISYGLSQNCHVKIEVFNLLGQKIATLLNSDQPAGYKTIIWDGKGTNGQEVSSGIYLYKLTAGKQEFSHKMTLLR